MDCRLTAVRVGLCEKNDERRIPVGVRNESTWANTESFLDKKLTDKWMLKKAGANANTNPSGTAKVRKLESGAL